MALRQIRLLGDSVLRKKSRKVSRFNDELQELAGDMVETMRSAQGVGLAAPQVGILERVIVVETPEQDEEPGSGQLHVVVNPKLIRGSSDLVDGIEGCLSIPGYVGEVTRHESAVIKGQDLQGRRIRINAEGFLARVFQHEIDHLEGVLFIDQLTAPDRIWSVDEGEEEQAEVPGATAELVPAELPLEILDAEPR
jgi:peptide deformylase